MLRRGACSFPVKAHDCIVHLPGGPELSHQLVNTGSEDLVYLAISTLVVPEVVGCPDSAKTGVRITLGEGPAARFLLPDAAKNAVDYWDGESGDRVAAIVAGSGAAHE